MAPSKRLPRLASAAGLLAGDTEPLVGWGGDSESGPQKAAPQVPAVKVTDARNAPTAMRIISMRMVRRAGATHSP
jgi:hypothetical protein